MVTVVPDLIFLVAGVVPILIAAFLAYLSGQKKDAAAVCCAALGCHAELANPLKWDTSMDWHLRSIHPLVDFEHELVLQGLEPDGFFAAHGLLSATLACSE